MLVLALNKALLDVFTCLPIIHKTNRGLFLRQAEGISKLIVNQSHPLTPSTTITSIIRKRAFHLGKERKNGESSLW